MRNRRGLLALGLIRWIDQPATQATATLHGARQPAAPLKYTHTFVGDERWALEALPRLEEPDEQNARATVTDGRLAARLAPELSDDGQSCPTMATDTPAGDADTAFLTRVAGLEPTTSGSIGR